MPVHDERRVLPYSPQALFDLVADIEKYPEFLPWCLAARIRSRQADVIIADLVIGHRFIRERFTSRVTLQRPPEEHAEGRIDVEYVEGPMQYMSNCWVFRPAGMATEVDFHVEFAFRSKMLEKLMGLLFHEAVTRMVRAFEIRAAKVITRSA